MSPPDPGASRASRYIRRVPAILLTLLITLLLAGAAINVWIVRRAAPSIYRDAARIPTRDVAIVPGASVHADGTPSDALADRLQAALDLYRGHHIQRILVSGAHPSAGYDEVGTMSRWLRHRGVPADAILADTAGERTFDTMFRAAQVYGVRSAILCTQGFHLPRSLFLAHHAGIDAIGLVADQRTYVGYLYNQTREFLARIRAVLDVWVLHTRPAATARPAPRATP